MRRKQLIMELTTIRYSGEPPEFIYFDNFTKMGREYTYCYMYNLKKPSQELSNAVAMFREGSNFNFSKDKFGHSNLEKLFNSNGIHFTAGYLTRFGLVAQNSNYLSGISFYHTKNIIRKITERDAYKMAISFWKSIQS